MSARISLLIIIFSSGLCGCVKADVPNQKKVESTSQTAPSTNHFDQHFNDAGKFLDLKHSGDAYRQQGAYDKALLAYKEALDKHAYSRPEQSIALDRIAMTYEAIGDFKRAADNYELSAEVTMNEGNRDMLKSKASALRAKVANQN